MSAQSIVSAADTAMNSALDRKHAALEAWCNLTYLKTGGTPLLGPKLRHQSATQDKFIICLNTSASGLSVHEAAYEEALTTILPVDEWIRRLTAIALAERYAPVLCTSGKFLSTPSEDHKLSWIQTTENNDDGSPQEHPLQLETGSYGFNPDAFDKYIELSMALPSQNWQLIGPGETCARVAATILETCAGLRSALDKTAFYYNWRRTFWLDEALTVFAMRCLGCILACGVTWMLQTLSFERRSFLYDALGDLASRKLSPYSSGGPDWLRTDLYNTAAEVEASNFRTEFRAWLVSSDDNLLMVEFLLQFVVFIIHKALPKPWTTETVQKYRPYIAKPEDQTSFMLVLPDEWRSASAAVPKELTADRFHDLKRVWFLDDNKESAIAPGTAAPSFRLLGKQMLFGPSISTSFSSVAVLRIYGPQVQ
jgi:hypothetical protein